MSYVIAAPEFVSAAASDLANLGSTLARMAGCRLGNGGKRGPGLAADLLPDDGGNGGNAGLIGFGATAGTRPTTGIRASAASAGSCSAGTVRAG